jgi:hypothetical protein
VDSKFAGKRPFALGARIRPPPPLLDCTLLRSQESIPFDTIDGEDFLSYHQQVHGEQPSEFAAAGAATGRLLEEAFYIAASFDPVDLSVACQELRVDSFFGMVSFDARGISVG